MRNFCYKKIISGILLATFVVPSAFFVRPAPAEAAVSACATGLAVALGLYKVKWIAGILDAPVQQNKTGEISNVIKDSQQYGRTINDCILKPIAKAMVVALIRNIGASIVDWVNSGFEGKPLFVTDFEGTVLDAADQTIGAYIEGSELGFLCDDFSFQIRLALALKYSRPHRDRVSCTLSDIAYNVETNGGRGWNNFLSISTEPQNNVYGAYLIAESELAQRALNAAEVKEKRVTLAQGFLDHEVCTRKETDAELNARLMTMDEDKFGSFDVQVSRRDGANVSGGPTVATERAYSDSIDHQCKEKTITTPGRVIADQLQNEFLTGPIQRAVAEEIDAVIAATMNQLAQKVIQGAYGLLGLSKKRSSGPVSYLDKYRSQLYGVAEGSPLADLGATSELDDYRIQSFDEAIALKDNGDPQSLEIQGYAERASADYSAADQQAIGGATQQVAGTSQSRNIALLKNTSQSSGSNPKNAVDGSTQTTQFVPGSSTDEDDESPWWQVDLGETVSIKEVRVWKVADKPATQTLETFRVIVSDGQGSSWTSPIISGNSASNPIVVPVGQSGSSVRIEKNATPHSCALSRFGTETCYYPLELAEVEVIDNVASLGLGANAPTSGTTGSSAAPAADDSRTGTSTLAWSPAQAPSVSLSSSQPSFNTEIRLGAEKNVQGTTVELALYDANGVNVPFNQIFADFDIIRGTTGGGKASTANLITATTGKLQFVVSVNAGGSYTFELKGQKPVNPRLGTYAIAIRVLERDGSEIGGKGYRVNFDIR